MPFDAVNISFIIDEMRGEILGGKIEKIGALDSHTFILSILTASNKKQLLLNASPSSPALFIGSVASKKNDSPPAFLYHLKRCLLGAIIKNIECERLERVVKFIFDSRDELGYLRSFTLTFEIMGRASNLFLLDEAQRIIAMHRNSALDLNVKRLNITGATYLPVPQQTKIDILDEQELSRLLDGLEGPEIASKLKENIKGVSPLLLNEIIYRALTHSGSTNSAKILGAFKQMLCSLSPVVIYKNSEPSDFNFTRITNYDCEQQCAPSLNNAALQCFSFHQLKNELLTFQRRLLGAVNPLIKKAEKLCLECNTSIQKSADSERFKQLGDIVVSNAHRIKKGEKSIQAQDFYSENCPTIIIELDERLSPSQNAQRLYKRYSRLKRTNIAASEQLEKTKSRLEYLYCLKEQISCAESVDELKEIELELETDGILSRKKSGKTTISLPYQYELDGYKIFAGKNNIQNDSLVKSAKGNDLWLHASQIHGSHIVIRGENPPQHVILKAAELAAYHSKARHSQNVAIDITQIKNVRKPAGAPPGKVYFVNQRTIYVDPKNFE